MHQVLLYAARHGEIAANKDNKFRPPANTPLDADGRQDADRLARFFAQKNLGAIIASSKKRTTQTAEIIAKRKGAGMPVVHTDTLHPWNKGIFAGQDKDKYGDVFEQEFVQHPERKIPGGESLNEFRARVHPVFQKALEIAHHLKKPVLLVTHSSVIHEMGQAFNGDANSALVKPGGVAAIGADMHVEPLLKPDTEERGKYVS